MAGFKIYSPAGPSPANFNYEMEALTPLGVAITEAPAAEDDFIAAAHEADALYSRGARITKRIIDALPDLKIITVGSVGVDYIDVAAATARNIPVTNCPDTFIEEVADHAMALLLSAHRRVVEQDRMVREGRWKEGRPALYQFPRLMGLTLGFVAFGHIPRAVATRARPFGLRMLAYDPFVEEILMPPYGVLPATLDEVLEQSDFLSMHAPGTPEAAGMLKEAHFRRMKKGADLHQHRPRQHRRRGWHDQGFAGGLDRPRRPRRARDRAPRPQQPAAFHDQRDPLGPCLLRVLSLRPGPQAPRWP